MHVLEDHHQAVLLAAQVEQVEQRVEQPQLRRRIVPLGCRLTVLEIGQERRERRTARASQCSERGVAAANQRPQRAQQRRVRELAIGLKGPAALEHECARVVLPQELGDQARLANAGVPADEDDHWSAAVSFTPRLLEFRELPDPADEVTACQAWPHAGSIAMKSVSVPA